MTNYLDNDNANEVLDFVITSYIDNTNKDIDDFDYLIENHRIFFEVNKQLELLEDSPQKELLYNALNVIVTRLKTDSITIESIDELPCLSASIDNDCAVSITWAFKTYSIFIDIEKNIEGSFCGIIGAGENGASFYKTEQFNNNNYYEVINPFLNYVLEIV